LEKQKYNPRESILMNQIKTAIIGLGDIARKAYLPILTQNSELDLFIHSRTPERVQQIQNKYHIPNASCNFDDVLNWQPNVVFILTPPALHAPMAERFLSMGVDVFLEKPATTSSEETLRLAEVAEQNKRVLMVGMNRRFAPINVQAKKMWEDRCTSLAYFEKHRAKPFHPNLFIHVNEEWIHTIDLMRFLCGESRAIETTYKADSRYMQNALCRLELENGGDVFLMGCMSAAGWQERYTLEGGGASLRIEAFEYLDWHSENCHQVIRQGYDREWKPSLEARGFVGEIDHFFQCVQTRDMPACSAYDAHKTQLLVEAIVRKQIKS
jgi:virulence factor